MGIFEELLVMSRVITGVLKKGIDCLNWSKLVLVELACSILLEPFLEDLPFQQLIYSRGSRLTLQVKIIFNTA